MTANATALEREGIVNLCESEIVLDDGSMDAGDYTVRVAALPLTRSATYVPLAEVISCAGYADPNAEVDAGKLILVQGCDRYRLGHAVNFLTTLNLTMLHRSKKLKSSRALTSFVLILLLRLKTAISAKYLTTTTTNCC